MIALGYRVLIKPEKIEEVTAGGIVLPETVREKERLVTQTGEVVGIGPECWDGKAQWVEVGDRVLYSKYAQKHIQDPDTKENYVIVNDEDVIAKLNKE